MIFCPFDLFLVIDTKNHTISNVLKEIDEKYDNTNNTEISIGNINLEIQKSS